MNLSDLKTRVDDRRRDVTNSFIADAEITRYLNECGRYLQLENDWDFTQTSATLSYVDGTNAYALSAIGNNDFKEAIDLFYTQDYKFSFVSPETFDYINTYDYNIYAVDGDFLKVSANVGSQTLSFNYYSTYMAQTSGSSWQLEMSDSTDSPLTPVRFQDIYVDFAMMRISEKEGNVNDIQVSRDSFDKKLAKMKERYRSKAQLLTIHMNNPRAYATPWYDGKEDPLRTTGRTNC